uniref:Uncharacterized protein n=1 Tax=Tanacetum cinerariifolium TaxID=118510 RepID=A0A6L2LQ43_TANCI|nr:hypothetical protein [Tanacetum cinerariifolium]
MQRLVLKYFEQSSRNFLAQKGRNLLENLDTLEAVIHRAVITYGILRMKENEINALKINLVQAVDDSMIISKSIWTESENNNALSKSMNETQLQQHESLVTESTTLEANLNMDIEALDVGPANDQVPFAEVQLTAQDNVLANEQHHTRQSKPIYDTYLLKNVDSNTTYDSKNMSHRGGEIDQNAKQYQVKCPLLNAELFQTKEMIEKEMYNELSHMFSPNKSFAVHEKPNTPRSFLRWKPTGRIFKIAGLRFIDNTTKVRSELPNGSNDDITNYMNAIKLVISVQVQMDDPNITMEEYIRLEEERARKHGKVYNWETSTYGKIWDNEDVHDLGSVETEFPVIVFNNTLTYEAVLSYKPMVSSLNDEIDFRISFDDSDDEDYTVIFDNNSFSYKIISVHDLKTDLENDNDNVNMPLLPSPKPTVSYFG